VIKSGETDMKEIIDGFFNKEHFFKRLVIVVIAVIMMGFFLSWLLLVDLGTDPCTFMNNSISTKIGMSLGNWQALLNIILLVFVIIFGGRNLGFGTIANMFLVGYSIDFFSWVWSNVLPDGLFDSWIVRIAVLFPALIFFVLSAAIYMNMDMGTAPYDAISYILSSHLPKIPFKIVRIVFDLTVTVIGILFGGKLGIVTVLMVFSIGPVVEWVAKLLNTKIKLF
jgi:uncharacterized membrane protein YczE